MDDLGRFFIIMLTLIIFLLYRNKNQENFKLDNLVEWDRKIFDFSIFTNNFKKTKS
jgi:hypothetical protein